MGCIIFISHPSHIYPIACLSAFHEETFQDLNMYELDKDLPFSCVPHDLELRFQDELQHGDKLRAFTRSMLDHPLSGDLR